uniref:Pco074498b n=1 Tax=Arundo donax TaxID=35708 RepID=A0A0A8XY91_ARUDO
MQPTHKRCTHRELHHKVPQQYHLHKIDTWLCNPQHPLPVCHRECSQGWQLILQYSKHEHQFHHLHAF